MTTEERDRKRRHEKYIENAEYFKAKSKAYYWDNREFILAKAAIARERKRKHATQMPKVFHRSIESKEQDLPWPLRNNTARLREEFLKIPILQRPPYDVYLKMKTIEYLRQRQYE